MLTTTTFYTPFKLEAGVHPRAPAWMTETGTKP